MSAIKFEIRHPNGQREVALIDGERALVGNASYCDVRLPMEDAAYEHLVVEVIGGTLRAEAKSDNPPATINGMPLTSSSLPDDAVLGVGRVRLLVTVVEDAVTNAEITAKEKKDSNPALVVASMLVFAAAAYLLLMEDDARIAQPPAQAPELFSQTPARCSQESPSQARAWAEEQMDVADGKRERLPFVPEDGIAAVALYERASACFEKSGSQTRAADANQSASSLKRDLNDDFRARRLRLSHTLNVEDYELAQRDVQVLRALTAGKTGRYVEWLSSVSKQLKSRGVQ